MIEVDLLDNRDEALAPRDIDTFAGRVIVRIIRVANTGDAGYHSTAISVENHKLCWLSRHHEEAAARFHERHWTVSLSARLTAIHEPMTIPIQDHHHPHRSRTGRDQSL